MSNFRKGSYSCGFNLGDKICRRDDEQHEGRVLAIDSHHVSVQWDDTNWYEYSIFAGDLKLVRSYGHARLDRFAETFGNAVREAYERDVLDRPKTVVESPRQRLHRELAEMIKKKVK
jgi:hypothetical protein